MCLTLREILVAYKEGKISTSVVRERLRDHKIKQTRSPLSIGQQGLWMLQKMSPEMSAYNVPICFRIRQKLDVKKFEEACRFVLTQHPVLSTVIGEDNGIPYQTVQTSQSPAFEYVSISCLGSDAIIPYLRERVKEPFSLERGPLMRIQLFSQSTEDHILLIIIHHIIFDGGSVLPLITSLFGAYQDYVQVGSSAPTSFSAGFFDFVAWEQKMLSGKEGEEHRSYWRQQLSGTLPTLELPVDNPRSTAQRYEGRTYSYSVPPELSENLKSFAKLQHMNLSAVFMSVFKVMLHKYTGQEDIILGMPTFGRPHDRFESQIGYFINMIPLRSRIEGSRSFMQVLRDMQLTLIDGLDHAAYPFPLMVRGLNIPRTVDSSVFQVSFMYQNYLNRTAINKFEEQHKNSLSLEYIDEIHQEGEYELVLEVFEQEQGFVLNIKYNPDLYDDSTIHRMMRHYLCLAEEAVKKPNVAIAEFSLMSKEEEQTVVVDWNETQRDYPPECFHELFQKQVQITPDAIAVLYENESLSYLELDDRSSLLAIHLQNRGVNPGSLVGICTERSLDMIVGLIGIHKAGGAYVPLDPEYPAERLEYMIQDSKASLVITQSGLIEKVSRLTGGNTKVIVLDRDWEEIAKNANEKHSLRREVRQHHLAYVIYTSGSTGKPKGVMVTHQGLTNFLVTMGDAPGLTWQDRMLAVTTYCFDIHGLELYLPLIKGARCYICSTEKCKDAELLKNEIRRVRATIMQATPATWKMLFHSGWRNEEQVKILCGGEPLTEALKGQFVDSNSEIWNMFGPTETTIWSTIKLIANNGPITIGKPIANTQIYILDKNLKPTPIGIPGELCIAGDCLARGYINRPELTAEKFIDNPFTQGTKLYKTGDLARWRSNGELEFFERIDNQVKIRGFRIELGEVEAQINTHPEIKDCAVIAKEYEGDKQLIAYFVAKSRDDESIDAQEMRNHLRIRLPEYMIPAFFIQLDTLPLTPNGKIDRKELTNRKAILKRTKESIVPQSAIEEKVLELWKDVLNLNDISTDEGFFEAGGNSISAVTLIQRIQKKFNCNIGAIQLFKYPNIKELSGYISEIMTT